MKYLVIAFLLVSSVCWARELLPLNDNMPDVENFQEYNWENAPPQKVEFLPVYCPDTLTLDKKYYWGVEWIEDKENIIIIHLKAKKPEEVK